MLLSLPAEETVAIFLSSPLRRVSRDLTNWLYRRSFQSWLAHQADVDDTEHMTDVSDLNRKKAPAARVQVIHETRLNPDSDGWQLCLQWGRYFYDDGGVQEGYRFIWRRPDGSLQAARGQARIFSRKTVNQWFDQAEAEGWGDLHSPDEPL